MFDSRPNVLAPIHALANERKPFPLIPDKPLEAQTTIEQSAIQIEDDSLHRNLWAHDCESTAGSSVVRSAFIRTPGTRLPSLEEV